MATLKQIDEYLKHPNVTKALDLIGETEGTDRLHGYYTNVGGKKITDVSKHPNVIGLRTKEGPSTAFGRYQVTNTTFNDIAPKLGITDMSPKNQDRVAIALMLRNNALDDIVKGDFTTAINKLGGTWASLPSSKYSQPKKSWDYVDKILGKNKSSSRDHEHSLINTKKNTFPTLAADKPKPPVTSRGGLSAVNEQQVIPNIGIPSVFGGGLGVQSNKSVIPPNKSVIPPRPLLIPQTIEAFDPQQLLHRNNPYLGLGNVPK